jgi:mannonate dehydratase
MTSPHPSPADEIVCRELVELVTPYLEDVLPPEHLAWYKQIRQICSTPQAVGEVFSHPFEYIPLVTDRLIDFVRCRVSAIGGITPAKKLANFCEPFGVRTAFQEGGDNDPVNLLAAYHIDISSAAFGVQEENHFPDAAREMLRRRPPLPQHGDDAENDDSNCKHQTGD